MPAHVRLAGIPGTAPVEFVGSPPGPFKKIHTPKMPLYLFESPAGQTKEFLVPHYVTGVEENGVKWSRCQVQRFAFVLNHQPPTLGSEVMRGYREQEVLNGSRFHTKIPVDRIKSAWANDREPLE